MNILLEKMNAIDYIYESIRNIYNKQEIFVYLKDNKWQLLLNKEVVLESRDAKDVMDYLVKNSYNLNSLEIYINESLLNAAVLAKINLRKTMKFFSVEEITKKEKDWDKLGQQMNTIISKTINKTKLTVVKNLKLVE